MLESILSQDYGNFEILMVDDASSDNSATVAKSIAGSRLRVISAKGTGLASALASGVTSADTELICRMDVDDIAKPLRLRGQVEFLLRNTSHVMVGSNVDLIDMRGSSLGRSHLPETDAEIRLRMTIGNPFAHSSVMFRREPVLAVGNYWSPDNQPFPEDYHLWIRLADAGQLANLRPSLVQYRVNETGVLRSNAETLRRHACEVSLLWNLKGGRVSMSQDEVKAWRACFGSNKRVSPTQALAVSRIMVKERLARGRPAARGVRLHHYLIPFFRLLRTFPG
jgi:glycosyltransferase involved in cell wall biosynthesis